MKGQFSLKAFVAIQEVRKCAHFIKYKILIFNLLNSAKFRSTKGRPFKHSTPDRVTIVLHSRQDNSSSTKRIETTRTEDRARLEKPCKSIILSLCYLTKN